MDPSRGQREADPLADEYNPSVFSRGLDRLVPGVVARRAVTIGVTTDRETYAPGEAVSMTVTVDNRLPLPIEVPIAERRVWGWSIDGLTEATDERIYEPDGSQTLSLRPGETRRYDHTWNGRIRREGVRTTYEPLSPGTHELSVFLGTAPRKTATAEITVR